MGRRLVAGWSSLVYVFLYAPIVVVIVYAFNGGRQVLNWEGFSTKWFGEALADPTITEPLKNSLMIGVANAAVACVLGTALALALPRMRPWVRTPIDGLVYMTLVTPEIVFGISALIFFVQAGIPLGLTTILIAHVVFNASVVALIVRARVVGMGEEFEEASYDLGAGPISTFRQVTLPLRIFSSLRFGISPIVNATAVMMLVLTLAAIIIAYLVLRRTAHGRREATALPGV